MPLTIHTRQVGKTPVLDLTGSLILGPSLSLLGSRAKQILTDSKPARMLLNMAGLDRVDSAGIGEIMVVYSAASGLNCRVALVGANRNLKQVLRITRVDGIVPTFDDEAAALEPQQSS